jgi:hypothetical protein
MTVSTEHRELEKAAKQIAGAFVVRASGSNLYRIMRYFNVGERAVRVFEGTVETCLEYLRVRLPK